MLLTDLAERWKLLLTHVNREVASGHEWAAGSEADKVGRCAPNRVELGPALLVEAQNAIDFGESLVARWLASYMLAGQKRAATRGKEIAHFFSDASMHKSHGRRIGREEARGKGLVIEDLEASQDLQEHALTAYHVMTIAFEHSQSGKMLASHAGRQWIKSHPIGTQVTS